MMNTYHELVLVQTEQIHTFYVLGTEDVRVAVEVDGGHPFHHVRRRPLTDGL